MDRSACNETKDLGIDLLFFLGGGHLGDYLRMRLAIIRATVGAKNVEIGPEFVPDAHIRIDRHRVTGVQVHRQTDGVQVKRQSAVGQIDVHVRDRADGVGRIVDVNLNPGHGFAISDVLS